MIEEKTIYQFDELETIYNTREIIDSKKEYLRCYVDKQLEKSHEMESYEIKAITDLLNFEESIPRLFGYLLNKNAPLVERQTQ
jgi:hypothetical protein